MFSHLENAAQELKFQGEMQNAWINFAHGESLKPGDDRVESDILERVRITYSSLLSYGSEIYSPTSLPNV